MKNNTLFQQPHRRLNILTGEWILVSPHRSQRPWQGQLEETPAEKLPSYDPKCYLCPGNERAGGKKNPHYEHTFVFDNDFSALKPDTTPDDWNKDNLLIAHGEPGLCRVICFSPRHDLTLAEMPESDILKVIKVWVEEYRQLGKRPDINYVQIFENKGSMMGCSNPHPHGQIWAQQSIPLEPAKELRQMSDYFQVKNKCLLCDYLDLEIREKERIVIENENFLALVPFWATWPFEILIVSRRHYSSFLEIQPTEEKSLAEILHRITVRYDNLFNISFPYSAGFHQAPTDGADHPEWHFHMHFYPPLLRSATIKKFMVGYEMLANPQRDITPEWSAEKLRKLSEIHYKRLTTKMPKRSE